MKQNIKKYFFPCLLLFLALCLLLRPELLLSLCISCGERQCLLFWG